MRKGKAIEVSTDYALPDALFLHTYQGYTIAKILGELDEEQYLALYRRIPHVQALSPEGIMARKL